MQCEISNIYSYVEEKNFKPESFSFIDSEPVNAIAPASIRRYSNWQHIDNGKRRNFGVEL